MSSDPTATAALCGPCSVSDHMGCLGDCGCGYCAEMRESGGDPYYAGLPRHPDA